MDEKQKGRRTRILLVSRVKMGKLLDTQSGDQLQRLARCL